MYAIATLVMNGGSYVPGAVALANSLKLFSFARLVCMVTDDVQQSDRDTLARVYDEVVVVERIHVNPPPLISSTAQNMYASWIADAPTKWNVLGLDRFEQVLFMDADMIAIAPMDEVFQVQAPAGVFDHQMAQRYVQRQEYTGTRGSGGIVNYYGDLKHGDAVPRDVVEQLKTRSGQFALQGGIVLVKPNRMVLDLYRMELPSLVASLPSSTLSGIDEITLTLFYHNHGYMWHHISMSYDVAAYHQYAIFRADESKERRSTIHALHYITPYKPWVETREQVRASYPQHLELYDLWQRMYHGRYLPTRVARIPTQGQQTLRQRLEDIFVPILGQRSIEVLDKHMPLYAQAFTHISANPAANYELMEAYGDRFLNGAYVWVLLDTPGIIIPDQVTKISLYFQDKFRLAEICDRLFLGPYIVLGDNATMGVKIKSDVIEALIACIAITWQRTFKRGDWAIHTFVTRVFESIFTIDPVNYRTLYTNPSEAVNVLAQQLFLNRRLIHQSQPQYVGGDVVVTIDIEGHVLGTGRVSMTGLQPEEALDAAKRAAYQDVLTNNRLQEYVASR